MGVPILIGLIIYLIYFLKLFQKKYKTISFSNNLNLHHYTSLFPKEEYRKIDDLSDYLKLAENYSAKDDLKTLFLLYFYQANYNRIGLKVRKCLIIGTIDLIVSIIISFGILIWLIWCFPQLF
ncbi:hypothetical protein LCGC14_1052600 [marine sediment metagenome]|uniref:Uncharacterized protein n=1 Tax=marine sediment metagenome TaxID=412755 RepID=A0A0F9NAA8_9ZZZZ|nr:MAG: hypothetical protein Lokiarch_22480 [Candidatus Lokiarchaeum sp. GC14_75]